MSWEQQWGGLMLREKNSRCVFKWSQVYKQFCHNMYGGSNTFVWFWAIEAWILWFLWMNNSTTEHDTTKLITSFYSESSAHSNDVNISCNEKIPKIGENPLIIDLAFHQNFAIFAMCSKHQTIYINRLTISSWTEWYKRFFHSIYGCRDILCSV